jgi:hypothetical protein
MSVPEINNHAFWIEEIAKIMATGQGPFTRKMIAEKLIEIHPLSYREGMLYISCAIEKDKHLERKFKSLKPGNWDLA